MTALRKTVKDLLATGSERALMNALDCDVYTRERHCRALDRLGWAPYALTFEERLAIQKRLENITRARAKVHLRE